MFCSSSYAVSSFNGTFLFLVDAAKADSHVLPYRFILVTHYFYN